MTCHNSVNLLDELEKWRPYQKVLERIVKRYTGMSVHAKLKEDVENLIQNMEITEEIINKTILSTIYS